MEHAVKQIAENPEKYVICLRCHCINWHENDKCIGCEVSLSGNSRKMVKENSFSLYQNIVNEGKNEDTKLEV